MTLWKICRQPKSIGAALIYGAVLAAAPALCSAATDTPPTATPAPVAPSGNAIDYAAFTRELTLTRTVDGRLTMAMWMPDQFWRASLQNGGRLTDQGVAQYMAVVHPYTLVAVMDAQRGITAFQYTDIETLDGEATIEDAYGEKYGPMAMDAIAEDMRNLIKIMRPLLASMMGSMGQHMEILVFPGADKAGRPIADPQKDGSLTVHLGDIAMRYRLPLGSVLPPTLDAKTGETFPGSYHFNPYTGNKLVPKPQAGH